ncbi:MAG: N-formylglutamate amidohydrolase [Sphaerochaeta sp.]|nr:N-formylglutamate amidohydrolase [Sphaerochaeta sp.]
MDHILNTNEMPAYEQFHISGSSSLFLTCDHASLRIPERLENLGLPLIYRSTHIGWDIGAFDVARVLSDRLDAPLVASRYSRLVIDCNRPPQGKGSIPDTIHGLQIPGNNCLSNIQIAQRIEEIFNPYHKTIDDALHAHIAIKRNVVLLSIHSYTPELDGKHRPWPIGITYETPSPFSSYLTAELKKSKLHPIGENEPYPITPEGDYGMYAHGKKNAIDAVLMEIRQDFLQNPESKLYIVELLSDILEKFDGINSKR